MFSQIFSALSSAHVEYNEKYFRIRYALNGTIEVKITSMSTLTVISLLLTANVEYTKGGVKIEQMKISVLKRHIKPDEKIVELAEILFLIFCNWRKIK